MFRDVRPTYNLFLTFLLARAINANLKYSFSLLTITQVILLRPKLVDTRWSSATFLQTLILLFQLFITETMFPFPSFFDTVTSLSVKN